MDPPPFPFGGSGLASTPRDYDKFLHMLAGHGSFEGNEVMSEAAVRMGTSNLLPQTVQAIPTPRASASTCRSTASARSGGSARARRRASTAGPALPGRSASSTPAPGCAPGCYTQYMPSDAYPLIDEFPAAILADIPNLLGGA